MIVSAVIAAAGAATLPAIIAGVEPERTRPQSAATEAANADGIAAAARRRRCSPNDCLQTKMTTTGTFLKWPWLS